jgi:hypothetical protein
MKKFFLLVGLFLFTVDCWAQETTVATESAPVQEQQATPDVTAGGTNVAKVTKRELARKKKKKSKKKKKKRSRNKRRNRH